MLNLKTQLETSQEWPRSTCIIGYDNSNTTGSECSQSFFGHITTVSDCYLFQSCTILADHSKKDLKHI